MTITPLTVYLIMQADSIASVFLGFSIILGVTGAILWLNGFIEYSHEDSQMSDYIKRTRLYNITSLFMAALLAVALMPSTKTLCASIVVPAITNSHAIQKDFPELYQLAVGKLKEQLQPAK